MLSDVDKSQIHGLDYARMQAQKPPMSAKPELRTFRWEVLIPRVAQVDRAQFH